MRIVYINEKELVSYFVDGAEVDFNLMLRLKLIKRYYEGYVLSSYGKTFL